jgi:hypothetical protein
MFKSYHGECQCAMCRGIRSDWLNIRVVDGKLRSPVEEVTVCTNCVATKEFWYLDTDNILKYNEVKRSSVSSIMILRGD